MDLLRTAGLFLLQHLEAVLPLHNIFRDHLQVQPVVERQQDPLLGVAEIRHLIGGGKEGDRGDRIGRALIGVLALVQRGQQRIEDPVVAFEQLVQKHDIRLRDLPIGEHPGFPLVEGLCQLPIALSPPGRPVNGLPGLRSIGHAAGALPKAFQ